MWTPDGKYILDRSMIFKGATRPPCVLGIPITPFIFVSGAILIFSFVVWIPFALLLIPVLLIMRSIAKDDDQRFLQLFLFWRVNLVGSKLVANYRCLRANNYKKERK